MNLDRYFRVGILVALCVTLGLGCKGLSQEELNAVQPITLNYWVTNADAGMIRDFASQYKQIRPYVTVNVRQVREEDFDQMLTEALADDQGPDIVSIDVTNIAEHRHRLLKMPSSVQVATLYERGTISKETVVEIFSNPMPSRSEIEDQYVSAVARDAIIGGNVYGLPLAIDTLGVYYNRELLDRAGIAQPPSDWEEFLDAVNKTTTFNVNGDVVQSGVAAGTMLNIPRSFELLSLLMIQNGVTMSIGERVTFSDGLSEANVQTHPTMQALRFYSDFADPSTDVYAWNSSMESALDAFVRGKTAFYFGLARDRKQIEQLAPQMDLEVIAVPQLRQDQKNIASYNLESVLKKSANPDEAWDFVRFITRPDKVLAYTERTGQPSPWRGQIDDQKANDELAPFASQSLVVENWYSGEDKAAVIRSFETLLESLRAPFVEDGRSTVAQRDVRAVNRAAQLIQQTY